MRKMIVGSMVIGALLLTGRAEAAEAQPAQPAPAQPAQQEAPMIQSLKKACNKELTTFCKGVPQGKGRILACLYAFEDKVTDKCMYALYDASLQLEQAVAALKYAAQECKGDLDKYCANVKPGEGRGLACLNKNEKTLSPGCKDALKDTGLTKK